MEDLIKKLRLLAIQEDKNRDQAANCLKTIENEIAYALYFLYGKNTSRSHSKIEVNLDEGLFFIYDFTDAPDKEGFAFVEGEVFSRTYTKLIDEKGPRFWNAISVIINWIPQIINTIVSQDKSKQQIIKQLAKLTESVKESDSDINE